MPSQYRIEIKRSAAKEIRAISRKKDRQRVVDRIRALADDPRPAGCTKLSGQSAYRVRQGEYRIIYTIADDVLLVEVVKVGHRRDVYR
ncbi:type II toxin-antitoxin system RelE family toxin [Rubrivirga sp.]|uniref:type II toxin-antitoxin system RelE family toxin n=1 Tax=Rubrivirga sp. TaxID=1885344 RepID=UPI003B515C08